MKWPPRLLPVLGFTVVLTVGAGILLASAYNRSDTPESVLRLSERELTLPAASNSGRQDTPLSLRLAWRVESMNRFASVATVASDTRAAWITPAKLAELHLSISQRANSNTYASTLLVLEFAGGAYARTVSRACEASRPVRDERACDFERKDASRLYVVDAGYSNAALRRRYPDRTHYAIAPGVIQLSRLSNAGAVVGYVRGLAVGTVQGIEPLRSTRDEDTGEMAWHRLQAQHFFTAVIAFGRHLEPWNVSITGRESGVVNPFPPARDGAEQKLLVTP